MQTDKLIFRKEDEGRKLVSWQKMYFSKSVPFIINFKEDFDQFRLPSIIPIITRPKEKDSKHESLRKCEMFWVLFKPSFYIFIPNKVVFGR